MIIGSFEYDKAQDTYLGDIVTLNFSVERVTFKPNARKADNTSPGDNRRPCYLYARKYPPFAHQNYDVGERLR